MRKIIKYKEFESVNGLDFGFDGVDYPKKKDASTLLPSDTKVIFIDKVNKCFTLEEYERMHTEWLGNGNPPLDGFSEDNLMRMLGFIMD